jgi:dethiobiotin synthetase
LPVVLVSLNRLGSINHTLLSVEAMLNRHLDILGIIFNGDEAPQSERFILDYTTLPMLGRIPWCERPDAAFVAEQANKLRPSLEPWLQTQRDPFPRPLIQSPPNPDGYPRL